MSAAVAVGLAVLVLGTVLAIGSVHLWAVLPAAAIGLGLSSFVAWKRGSLPAPAWVLLALAAYTIVQALPLPMGLVGFFAPQNADVWQRASDVLGTSVVPSLSLDPGASWVEAAKWALYAGVFSIAAFVGRRQGATVVLGIVFAAAMAVALLTLGHKIVGATKLYGLYTPKWAHPNFALAPLLNTNNLAGYLNLGAFVGVGLFMARAVERMRWLSAVGVSLVVAVSALGASRGGWASLAIGVVCLAAILLGFARRGRSFQWVMFVPLVAIAAGVVLFYSAVSDRVFQAARGESMKKLDLISWTKPMILDHPWWGVGRGAFESVFPRYRQDTGYHAYQYAENVGAQWAVEWGLPIAIMGCLALLASLWPVAKRSRASLPAACAVLGVVVLVIHNMFDLALEITSVCVAAFAVLGAVWGARAGEQAFSEASRRKGIKIASLASLAAIGGIPVVVTVAGGAHTAVSDREAVTQVLGAVEAGDTTRVSELGRAVAMALQRRPADPYLMLVGAIAADKAGKNPLPWIARAIELEPIGGRPHLLLARVLARRGARAQALLGIRMAVEREYGLTDRGAQLAVAITQERRDLLQSVPKGKAGAPMLLALARRVEDRDTRARLLDDGIGRDPDFAAVRYRRMEDVLRGLEGKSTGCDGRRKSCIKRGKSLLAQLEAIEPGASRVLVTRARLLIATDRPTEAERYLADSCARLGGALECWRWQIIAADRAQAEKLPSDGVEAYMQAACVTSRGCATAANWLGAVHMRRREYVAATEMFERAANETNLPAAWAKVAHAAGKAGLETSAARARAKAEARTRSASP